VRKSLITRYNIPTVTTYVNLVQTYRVLPPKLQL
jgi:hypothetical protein